MKRRHKISFGTAVIVVSIATAAVLLPWKLSVAAKLERALEAKGFQDVHLSLAGIGLHKAAIENVTVGNDKTILLKNLTVGYSPFALRAGRLESLDLRGLALDLRRQDGQWTLQGYKNVALAANETASFHMPTSLAELSDIPADRVTIAESRVNVTAGDWLSSTPVTASLSKNAVPDFSLKTGGFQISRGDFGVTGSAEIYTKLQTSHWAGQWQIHDLEIKKGAADLPPLTGSGTIDVDGDTVALAGAFKSQDNAWRLTFTLIYSLKLDNKSGFTVSEASMPWKGGTIAVHNVKVRLTGLQPIKILLELKSVSIDALLQSLTGKHLSATGTVFGALPVTISREGAISVAEGVLQATGPGTISMPPDTIPGNNKQIEMVRQILKNFHYSGLSVAMQGGQNNGLALTVALEGRNPDAYDGQPVKLNVRLAGDVLNFVKQNMTFFNDPKSMLKASDK